MSVISIPNAFAWAQARGYLFKSFKTANLRFNIGEVKQNIICTIVINEKRRLRMFGHIPCIPTPDGPHWRSNSIDFKYQPSSWWDIVQCHGVDHYCFRLSGAAVSCKERNINIWHGECLRHLDNIRRLWLERCQRRLIKYIATLYRRILSIGLHLSVVDQPTMSV